MSWSAHQRRMLDALGYQLLVPGRVGGEGLAVEPAPAQAPAAAVSVAVAATAASDRLLEALRRAANGADPRTLVDDLERLRRDPALKRALWPRLRALRRSH